MLVGTMLVGRLGVLSKNGDVQVIGKGVPNISACLFFLFLSTSRTHCMDCFPVGCSRLGYAWICVPVQIAASGVYTYTHMHMCMYTSIMCTCVNTLHITCARHMHGKRLQVCACARARVCRQVWPHARVSHMPSASVRGGEDTVD